MMAYTVKALLVQAKLDHGGYVHLYQGAVLPDNMDSDQLDQLVEAGMVEGAPDGEPDPEQPEFPKPAGNASQEAWATYALESGRASEDEIAGRPATSSATPTATDT